MARILYVWELGDNYGHMSSFSAIAAALTKRGHEVVVALQNLTEAGKFFDKAGVTYLQAPLWRGKLQHTVQDAPITYADVIRNYGFTDSDGLATLLQAWQGLYRMVAPDIALFNAPPVSLLAARNQPFKKATLGPGYSLPPRSSPLPSLRSWEKIAQKALKEREDSVLEVSNKALNKLNLGKISSLQDIFITDEDFLCTFKEFDHYQHRGEAEYYGAMFSIDTGGAPVWPSIGGKKLFAYIRPNSKHFIPIIRQLYDSEACVLVAAPGAHPDIIKAFTSDSMHFSTEPLSMQALRQECDAAICHAGHGTSAAFLTAGIPLMLFPNHLEQFMLARNLLRTGAVMMPDPGIKRIPYGRMIQDILTLPHFSDAAEKLAFRYKGFSIEKQCDRIIERIELLL